ncbi:winged helix-turn-helix domain-containing protein [Psychroserpens sp. XS_ASV72]|uniref:winged helix-turn-helix domain-containing protein n=1 Tax=Psychroserpens sp. XS_ASV72 TaxID=3241293 RepID=UPI003512EE57
MKKLQILIFSVLFSIVFLVWLLPKSDDTHEEFSETVKISLRDVGNTLLLTNRDSTSLILPVKEIEQSKYRLAFQNHLEFNPDELVNAIKNSFETTNLPNNYRVEVQQCETMDVSYSYEMNVDLESTLIPCLERKLPLDCYFITVRFIDASSVKQNQDWIYISLLVILLFLALWTFKSNQKLKNKNSEMDTPKSEGYHLGSFKFYPEQNILVKSATEINLSKKECEILEIFVANKNQVVKRDELTKKVWEDNGVIVGRSLDTYISKLRKKLKEDASIKLTNVHGIGYKLEID